MKTIYVFSNSHGMMFDPQYQRAEGQESIIHSEVRFVNPISGVATCYSIRDHDENMKKQLSLIEFGERDVLWMSFGEIDVRFHIFYYHEKDKITVDESIDRVVDVYFSYIRELKNLGVPICVTCCVPPQPNDSPFHNDPSYQIKDYIRGDGLDVAGRVYITERLNLRFKEECEKSGIPYIDFYELIVDQETRCVKMEWSKDGMHYLYIGDVLIEGLKLYED